MAVVTVRSRPAKDPKNIGRDLRNQFLNFLCWCFILLALYSMLYKYDTEASMALLRYGPLCNVCRVFQRKYDLS